MLSREILCSSLLGLKGLIAIQSESGDNFPESYWIFIGYFVSTKGCGLARNVRSFLRYVVIQRKPAECGS